MIDIYIYIWILRMHGHGDTPWQDFELFRVWDSLVLEDEQSKLREWGSSTTGHMDDSQAARNLMYLGALWVKQFIKLGDIVYCVFVVATSANLYTAQLLSKQIEILHLVLLVVRRQVMAADPTAPQSSLLDPKSSLQQALPGPVGHGADQDGQPNPKDRKGKKPRKGKKDKDAADPDKVETPKYNKKVSNKINTLSTKLTELRCLTTQLKTHSDMKLGFLINIKTHDF